MTPRAPQTCSKCNRRATHGNRCDQHKVKRIDARPSSWRRGYNTEHINIFRAGVLARDPVCVWPDGCQSAATEADHYPKSRRELVALGLDPNDPRHGRGLCRSHHSQSTAREQPGGFRKAADR